MTRRLVGNQGFQSHTVCSTSITSPLTRSVTNESPGITSEDLRIRAALQDSEKPARKIVSSHSRLSRSPHTGPSAPGAVLWGSNIRFCV